MTATKTELLTEVTGNAIVAQWLLGLLKQGHLDLALAYGKITEVQHDSMSRATHWHSDLLHQMLLVGDGILTYAVVRAMLQLNAIPKRTAFELMTPLELIKDATRG